MRDVCCRNTYTSSKGFLGNSSMLRHGLRLICIKSNNDHNFVKIYQNLPKFGSLGKIGNLNFSVA